MPGLAIFSRRQLAVAALGFLAGSMILPGLSTTWMLLVHSMLHHLGPMFLLFLAVGLIIRIGGFFWTIGQFSIWSAQGSRLAHICYRIWMGTACVMVAANFILSRAFNPISLVPIVLLYALRPKPGGSEWTWPLISILERQESQPFLWGIGAALGFQIMSMALGPSLLQSNIKVASAAGGPASIIAESLPSLAVRSLAALAMGFVLGALVQAWTKQRWPTWFVSIMCLLGAGVAFALADKIPFWVTLTPWVGVAWSIGLLLGDFAAAHEQSEPLPAEASG